MQRLLYALQFSGRVEILSVDGAVLRESATAPSCAIGTTIATGNVRSEVTRAPGDEATLESEVILTGATTFQEVGVIRFGTAGDRLRFSTLGSGYLGPSPAPGLRHGAAMRRIDGGEGRFAGASGLITSNFTLGGDVEITDLLVGVIHLPSPGWATSSGANPSIDEEG